MTDQSRLRRRLVAPTASLFLLGAAVPDRAGDGDDDDDSGRGGT